MLRYLVVVAALAASPVQAQEATKYASFSFDPKRSAVTGSYIVGGYSPAQVQKFIARECKGAVGAITLDGAPRKRRGNVFQRYTTTCAGGAKRFPSVATFEVEVMAGGKTLVEITASDGKGNIGFMTENW